MSKPKAQSHSDELEDPTPGGESNQEPERTPLEQAEAERDEYLEHWQRAKADYQNLRRRILEDIDAAVHRETQGLMQEMLTVLDYLDMALATPCESADSKNLQMGVQMTRTQLWNALERQGVKRVPTEGLFDPTVHQAMATVETNEVEPGTIMDVVRAGFQKQGFVLRHAQVKVAQAPQESDSADQDA
ncbi:MAG: nucleotide exchange factor GrpE [Planctomycetes bacterium]|nr:nucleotide exchange factor GrpE [Planctomycetota bacterium]MCB9909468.1 nucleotide exchange factor GrpE [Planctomycetota bacterium]HPF13574.1 nucleotide exchange factor GrpE [Planctomycetota bacterium]HRV81404.1 nucleotide exchange factor GrpE [Planctomycetota bacterium]